MKTKFTRNIIFYASADIALVVLCFIIYEQVINLFKSIAIH